MKNSALSLIFLCLVGAAVASAQDREICFKKPLPVGYCYVLANQKLSSLPPGPLYWHLYTYPSLEAAPKGDSMNTVVEAHGKIWLFRIAPADWKVANGEQIAMVGPLVLPAGVKEFIAHYMEDNAPIEPGRTTGTPVHYHFGPEAWYLLGGEQCMQMPGKTLVVRAGQSAAAPPNTPMVLFQHGHETRKSLVLVLHDASQPWMMRTDEWTPEGECPVS